MTFFICFQSYSCPFPQILIKKAKTDTRHRQILILLKILVPFQRAAKELNSLEGRQKSSTDSRGKASV